MKWVSITDLVTLFLCPQKVSDFEHVMSVNGRPGNFFSVSSVCE